MAFEDNQRSTDSRPKHSRRHEKQPSSRLRSLGPADDRDSYRKQVAAPPSMVDPSKMSWPEKRPFVDDEARGRDVRTGTSEPPAPKRQRVGVLDGPEPKHENLGYRKPDHEKDYGRLRGSSNRPSNVARPKDGNEGPSSSGRAHSMRPPQAPRSALDTLSTLSAVRGKAVNVKEASGGGKGSFASPQIPGPSPAHEQASSPQQPQSSPEASSASSNSLGTSKNSSARGSPSTQATSVASPLDPKVHPQAAPGALSQSPPGVYTAAPVYTTSQANPYALTHGPSYAAPSAPSSFYPHQPSYALSQNASVSHSLAPVPAFSQALNWKPCDAKEVVREDVKRTREGKPGIRDRYAEFEKFPENDPSQGRSTIKGHQASQSLLADPSFYLNVEELKSIPPEVRQQLLNKLSVKQNFIEASLLDEKLAANPRIQIGDSKFAQPGCILWMKIRDPLYDRNVAVDDPDRDDDMVEKDRPCIVYKRNAKSLWMLVGRSHGDRGHVPDDLYWETFQLLDDVRLQYREHDDVVRYSSSREPGMRRLTKLTFFGYEDLDIREINLKRATYEFGGRLTSRGYEKLANLKGLHYYHELRLIGRSVERQEQGR